jgi:peptidyl-prolyl cis-trans isomerase C
MVRRLAPEAAMRHALTLLLLSAALAGPAAAQDDPDIARVGGDLIRRSDVESLAAELLPAEMRPPGATSLFEAMPPELREQLIQRAIAERALLAEARRRNLQDDPLLRARVKRAEEQELVQALLAREAMLMVTDVAIRERFDAESARRQGEPEVRARHILTRTEPEARAVIAELAKGADFTELAKRRSTDPSAAQNGGDLGFFKRADMVKEFADAAFALNAGQTSPAPVRSSFGFHVIRVEEKRTTGAISFEQARDTIRQRLLQEQAESIAQRVQAAATVERLDGAASR